MRVTLQSQEVTYAELTMPRNKGYAPMRARSTDSPVNDDSGGVGGVQTTPLDAVHRQHSSSSFKIRGSSAPQPPPRYTSPPTRASALRGEGAGGGGGGGAEEPLLGARHSSNQHPHQHQHQDSMPLVSRRGGGGGGGEGGSLPAAFRARSSTNFGFGLGGTHHGSLRGIRGRRGGMQNRRTRELRENAECWSSAPEEIQEEDEVMEAESDSAMLDGAMEDIHEKRRRMMGRMRACRTQQHLDYTTSSPDIFRRRSPDQDGGGASVPQGLLERRRVLLKALKTIQTDAPATPTPTASTSSGSDRNKDWNSLPGSFDRRAGPQQQQQQHRQELLQHRPPPPPPPLSADEKRRRFVRWHSSAVGLGQVHSEPPAPTPGSDHGGFPSPSSRPCTPGGARRRLPRIPSAQELDLRRQLQAQPQFHHQQRPSPFRRQTSLVSSPAASSLANRSSASVRSELLETIQSGSFDSGDSV